MADLDDENARVFIRTYANKLKNGYSLVTAHLVVRDNRNRFFFVNDDKNKTVDELKYDVIDYDTIVITNYPDDTKSGAPNLNFFFSTDEEETKELKDFELFIQFTTKKIHSEKKALTIKGYRKDKISKDKTLGKLGEMETDKGIVYFPDV